MLSVSTQIFMNLREAVSPLVANSVFLPQRGGGGLRSEAEQTGGGSPHAVRHVPLRLAEPVLRPRFARTGGLGTSPTLGEETWAPK
jgi:hypothetical protein